MCPRVLRNTNDFAVLTGRSMDWPYLVGNVAGRFAPRQIGF